MTEITQTTEQTNIDKIARELAEFFGNELIDDDKISTSIDYGRVYEQGLEKIKSSLLSYGDERADEALERLRRKDEVIVSLVKALEPIKKLRVGPPLVVITEEWSKAIDVIDAAIEAARKEGL